MYLKVEMFPPAVEVRAILEGQFLARRMYTEMNGLLGETKINLGHVATKPVFGVSEKASFKPVSSATETS